eukprot:TRINITY_DN23483_c0_g1_i4.p1 TRINITY_DN23483_c0_g1~~TRINITY_DN23483_c0_g1_i4.p1  ORF type:complete len:281 (+),score=66.96 TRINITY_DN23483_c0_g1_i4:174-1016(+)
MSRLAVLFLAVQCAETQSPVPTPESAALVALYDSTDGSGWTKSDNWQNADKTGASYVGLVCNWYGVDCDGTSNVLYLDLKSNQLSGTLPDSLASLTALIDLVASHNQHLGGSLPATLSAMKDLEWMSLWNNSISGTIPSSYTHSLSAMTELDVSLNNISGTLPSTLSSLNGLKLLFVEQNFISGTVPTTLDAMGLTQFLAHTNAISGTLPTPGFKSTITTIALHTNGLSGTIPDTYWNNMTNLAELDLMGNWIEGTLPTTMPGMQSLTVLTLYHLSLIHI